MLGLRPEAMVRIGLAGRIRKDPELLQEREIVLFPEAATLLLTAGVHPKVVYEKLGHSSVAITLDRYSHLMPTMQEEAGLRMDRMLSNPAGVQTRMRRTSRARKAPIHARIGA